MIDRMIDRLLNRYSDRYSDRAINGLITKCSQQEHIDYDPCFKVLLEFAPVR